MTVSQFKAFALQTMCEEHLWKNGESSEFTLLGWRYKIEKSDGLFHLYLNGQNKKEGGWCRHDAFPTMNRLFASIFYTRCISYE